MYIRRIRYIVFHRIDEKSNLRSSDARFENPAKTLRPGNAIIPRKWCVSFDHSSVSERRRVFYRRPFIHGNTNRSRYLIRKLHLVAASSGTPKKTKNRRMLEKEPSHSPLILFEH